MKVTRIVLSALSLMLLATLAGAKERVKGPVAEEGTIAGADFLIEIPENWNGGLLMYAHGYTLVYQSPGYNRNISKTAAKLGYAVAQSKYSHQGWAAREGILDTESLRRYFVQKFGETHPTIVAGHSMGGFISFATIERFPEVYDGALPMCGAGEAAIKFFKERVFDMRLLFDYYFPGCAGSAIEFPDGEQTMTKVGAKAAELIEANPEGAKKFIQLVNLPSVESIPGVLGFWSEVLREMSERCGGNPFDNRETVYAGSENDAKLNHEIPRHAAKPKAQEYLIQWATATGHISDPVVALHTLVDQLVPIQTMAVYEAATTLEGTSDHFVQLYVDRVGHCNFTDDEMLEALTRLDRWIREGKRPAPGDITIKK